MSLVEGRVYGVEHLCKAGVRGSIPLVSTKLTSRNRAHSTAAVLCVTPYVTRVGYSAPCGACVQGPETGARRDLPAAELWLRVRVYAGIDPVTKRRHDLLKIIPAGPNAQAEVEANAAAVRSELEERRNPHIDLVNGVMTVRRSIAQDGTHTEEKDTKTHQRRHVALDPETVSVLSDHPARCESRSSTRSRARAGVLRLLD